MNLKEIDYPLYKYYHSFDTILNNLNNLKLYEYDISKSKNPIVLSLLHFDFDRDEKYQRITDYFSEDIRIKCNFKNHISPYDFFNLNKQTIINSLGEEPDYKKLDNYLYSIMKIKECSKFNLLVSLFVLNYFKPKRWLDPSAGWGDRLISAISYGECEYRGVDPNNNMTPKYKEIIDTLVDNNIIEDNKDLTLLSSINKVKYSVIESGFEDINIENDYFDLVFTSPPFFDLESYSKDDTQSDVKFKTLDEWRNGFLVPFLIKATRALSKNGHLCLYINNFNGYNYVNDVKNYLKYNKKMKFKGYISWQQDKTYIKNIIVYQKILK